MTGGEIPKTEYLSGELYCSECKHTPPGASGVEGMSAGSWERGAGAGMLPKEGVQGGSACTSLCCATGTATLLINSPNEQPQVFSL